MLSVFILPGNILPWPPTHTEEQRLLLPVRNGAQPQVPEPAGRGTSGVAPRMLRGGEGLMPRSAQSPFVPGRWRLILPSRLAVARAV